MPVLLRNFVLIAVLFAARSDMPGAPYQFSHAAVQDVPDPLYRAVIQHLSAERLIVPPGTVIRIDPRVYQGGTSSPTPLSAQHSKVVKAALAIPGVSEITSDLDADRCASYAPDECMRNGSSVVLSFSEARIKNDSAEIEVLVRGSSPMSAAEVEAALKGPGGRMKVSLRRAAAAGIRVFATKTASGWVVRHVMTWQT